MINNNVTFAFHLGNHPNRSGLYSVMMRVTQNRQATRAKTDLEVKKSDWNSKAKNYKHFRSSCVEYAIMNDKLMKILNTYREAYEEIKANGKVTAKLIINKVNGVCSEEEVVEKSFIQFVKNRTQQIYNEGNIRNWKKYNGLCNKLETYMNKKGIDDISFEEVTVDFLDDFLDFLNAWNNQNDTTKRLKESTKCCCFCILKTLVNFAIKHSKMSAGQNPFPRFSRFPKEEKTVKDKLSAQELEAMLALDLPEGGWLWHARNYFFFSFYCCGIRVGDLLQLRWRNIKEGRLLYVMDKNGKVRDMKLMPQALKILSYYKKGNPKPQQYIFPLLSQNSTWGECKTDADIQTLSPDIKAQMFVEIGCKTALINKYLKKIAQQAKVTTNVSMHIARHSFAKAAKEMGIDNLQVKALLAHTNLATTERYMGEFDTDSTDAAMEKIFERGNEKENLIQQLMSLDSDKLKAVLQAVAI